MDRGGEGHPVRAERTKGGAAEGSPTLTEPCSGCGSVISRRMTKHPYPAPHPPESLSRPHGSAAQMPPAARKRSGPGAEVRTAGSSASIRAPVSPTGPTLPTKKSNRPHEKRVLRVSPFATVRRFHTPEDPERFRPVRMLSPRKPHRTATVPAPFATPTIPHGFLLLRRPPVRKKKAQTIRNRGNGPTSRSSHRRTGRILKIRHK